MTIETVQHDDAEAIVAQWRPWIIRKAGEILGSQTWLYDDAIQEGMVAMWTRLDQGLPVTIALNGAKQAILDVARGRRLTGSDAPKGHAVVARKTGPLVRKATLGEEYELEPVDQGSEVAYRQVEVLDALAPALGSLTALQLAAVQAVYLDGMTAEDYAKTVGVSGQAIRYRLKKALGVMRDQLGDAA